MSKKEESKISISHIDIEVAKKLHRQLEKMLEEADNKKVFEYDTNAHSDFCAEVVKMMDIMVGQTAAKYKKS